MKEKTILLWPFLSTAGNVSIRQKSDKPDQNQYGDLQDDRDRLHDRAAIHSSSFYDP